MAQNANIEKESTWQGLTAIIFAILGCFLFWMPFVNYFCGIMALSFGIFGLKTRQRIMSIVSIVTAVIVLCFSLLMTVMFFVSALFVGAHLDEFETFGQQCGQATTRQFEVTRPGRHHNQLYLDNYDWQMEPAEEYWLPTFSQPW